MPPSDSSKRKNWARTVAILLGLAILCIGGCVFLRRVFHSGAKTVGDAPGAAVPAPVASASTPPQAKVLATPKPPSYEDWFISSCRQYESEISADADAARIPYFRSERSRAISNALPGVRTLSGWVGTLRKSETTIDGRLAIAIELPNSNILLQTWGDAVSDAGAGTLIAQKSDLYSRLRGLAVGVPVSFDGELLPDKDDWAKEGSKTPREGLVSPKFIVRFQDVKRVGN